MKKSFGFVLVIILILLNFSCSKRNSEKANENPGEKYYYVKDHPTEFFSADVKVEKVLDSYANIYDYYWIYV
jgi:hypothetical protein